MQCFIGWVAAVSFALLSISSTSAGPIHYSAFLDGPSESPPNSSPGIGYATFVFDPDAHILTLNATFEGLIGTTTAAHIHGPTPLPGTGTAGVATMVPTFLNFPLGVTVGTYSATFDTSQISTYNPAFVAANGGTPATAEAALGAMLASGRAYLNIHSTTFPGGEIRGFIQPVPEPSSLAIWSMGMVGACGYVRARTRRRAVSVA